VLARRAESARMTLKYLTRIIHRWSVLGWRVWHKRLNSCMNLSPHSFITI